MDKKSLKEYKKEYYEKNKEHIKERNRKYQEKNKEKYLEYQKKWLENNTELKKERDKKYRKKKKEERKNYDKNYYERNKNRKKESVKNYKKNRMKLDPLFRLTITISANIRHNLKKHSYAKNSKTQKILGCSFTELKSHLESKFENWMSWDNKGLYNGQNNYGWDIDHIIPLSSAKTEEELLKLFHYTNLQPLCSKINRTIKKDKMWNVEQQNCNSYL